MKIAYFTPLYFDEKGVMGGGERYPQNLALGVVEAAAGACRVELVSYGARELRRELAPGVGLRVLEAAGRPQSTLDLVSWDVPRTIAEFDLIHAHQIFTRSTELVALCAAQQGKPLAFTDHGGLSSGLGRQVGILELADRLICQSEFAAAQLRTRRPVDVVKGGVDDAYFTPSARPARRGYVLFVGRLVPHKGVEHLIEALPAGMELKICGRPYHADYHAHLQRVARGRKVEFLTAADDATVRELYRHAWANVLPSMYRDRYGGEHVVPELMGFSLLEAMACGTPAICRRVGAMPEFVRHGETGFVFDTVEQLGKQLAFLARRPDEVERMGAEGRAWVAREFGRRVVGERLYRIYRDVMLARPGAEDTPEAA